MIKRTVKAVKDFAQYDTRWAKKPYAKLPACMSANGCGPTSAADVIASHPNHNGITPNDTRLWLINHKYVVNGQGTIHDGIPAILKAYGFSVKQYTKMSEVFEQMAKGKRRAIFLMNSRKAPDGKIWTASGHFVAIKGYKTDGKKHWFYVCDPGQRRRDGWFCYETAMKGCISKTWVAYIPSHTLYAPVLPKRGHFTKGDKGAQVKRLQKMLKAAGYKITVDGIYGTETEAAVKAFKIKYKVHGKKKNAGKGVVKRLTKMTNAKKPKTFTDEFIESLRYVFKYMKANHFHYEGYGNPTSWEKAKKEKTANCAAAVVYSLQVQGVLKAGQSFYFKGATLKCNSEATRKNLLKYFTYKVVNKSAKGLTIKRGTICGYTAPHTQVFYDRTKAGSPRWFSYGPGDVGDNMPKVKQTYNDRIISAMLIPKN